MKPVAWILAVAALTGCAAHHVRVPPSTDWSVVQRLPPGTDVVAYICGASPDGRIETVGADDIVLRTERGLTSIARADIFMLAQRTPLRHERGWNMLTDALWLSMVGALFLPIIDDDLPFMAVVAGSGAAVGAMARPRMSNQKTIYVRPGLR
jgi:hypothetical protein